MLLAMLAMALIGCASRNASSYHQWGVQAEGAGDYLSAELNYERALEDARQARNEAEFAILAVEAMEREVNNGGYHQFFLNTPEYAPFLVAALQRIDCPKTAEISTRAISLIGLHEPIADRLFAYIRANRGSIRVGKPMDRDLAKKGDA